MARSDGRQPPSQHRLHDGPRPPAGGRRKRGTQRQASGRSRGGFTCKVHCLGDARGLPLVFHLTCPCLPAPTPAAPPGTVSSPSAAGSALCATSPRSQRSLYTLSSTSCGARARVDHPLRPSRAIMEAALKMRSVGFAQRYSRIGRPLISPEKMLRVLLLQAFYSMHRNKVPMPRDTLTCQGQLLRTGCGLRLSMHLASRSLCSMILKNSISPSPPQHQGNAAYVPCRRNRMFATTIRSCSLETECCFQSFRRPFGAVARLPSRQDETEAKLVSSCLS